MFHTFSNYNKNKFKYILVDEYQDTNHIQSRWLNLLAEKNTWAKISTEALILYADKVTKSINKAIKETDRRRNKQCLTHT